MPSSASSTNANDTSGSSGSGWGAAIGLIGTGLSAYYQSKQAKKASESQVEGFGNASATEWAKFSEGLKYQEAMLGKAESYTAPWREVGANALKTYTQKLLAGPGELTESPNYKFVKSQGEEAINRMAASKGKLFSGGTATALTDYNQKLASMEYDKFLANYEKDLAAWKGLSDVGADMSKGIAGGALGVGSSGLSGYSQVGANMGGNLINQGQARAGYNINNANIYGGASKSVIEGLSSYYNT